MERKKFLMIEKGNKIIDNFISHKIKYMEKLKRPKRDN